MMARDLKDAVVLGFGLAVGFVLASMLLKAIR